MGLVCCIVGCKRSNSKHHASFYRIPAIISENNRRYRATYLKQKYRASDFFSQSARQFIELSKIRQEKWIEAIRRGELSESQLKTYRVCSRHFIEGN